MRLLQVPIYTLHMLTFPQPERFWPERWTNSIVQKKASTGSMAPTAVHVEVGRHSLFLYLQSAWAGLCGRTIACKDFL